MGNAWDHCPVGNSNDAQASASSLTASFLLGFPDTSMNPSCLTHAAGFQCQRMQSSPRASTSHHHAWLWWVFLSSFFFLQIHLLIHRAEKFQFCFIAPQNRIPKLLWLIYMILSRLFLCFWVSIGVRLGVLAWKPLAFSTHLTVLTETSMSVTPSLAAGLLQSLEGFSQPAFSEIWLQPLTCVLAHVCTCTLCRMFADLI